MEVLLKEHPLVKLFEQGFMLMNEFIQFKINYVGLSQHYYNNTHLLDLTSDMEVAKFFAVTKFDMKNDCYFEYKGEGPGVLYYYDIQADTFNKRKGRRYNVDTIGKQPFMRSGNQSGFLVNMEREDDFNLFPEVRYVFFRHDPDITSRIFKEAMNGDKYMPQEILRSHWHKRMMDEEEKMKISSEALKLNFKNNPHKNQNCYNSRFFVVILGRNHLHILRLFKQIENPLNSAHLPAPAFQALLQTLLKAFV
jgi:hypothetical protein